MNGGDARARDRCAVCGAAAVRGWSVRDHRFGIGGSFTYLECGGCASLTLADPPRDSAGHYPRSYYSFNPPQRTGIVDAIRRARNRLVLQPRGPVGRFVARIKPHAASRWLARTRTTRDSRVLDVGTGAGDLLHDLARAGFRHLRGVDPLIDHDIRHPTGFAVDRAVIQGIDGRFDLVMFNHSLEHVPDPGQALAAAAERLDDGGWCLVRLPVVPCFAWEHYREQWVQIDAPRHTMVPSRAGMEFLGAGAGLRLEAVEFDSTEFQFAGSECYRRGLPLDAIDSAFSRAEHRRWADQARVLNDEGRGDQAAFYFRKR